MPRARFFLFSAAAALSLAAACSNDYQLADPPAAADGGLSDADVSPTIEAATSIGEDAAPDADADADAGADAATDAGPPAAPLVGRGCAMHPNASTCMDFEGVAPKENGGNDAGVSVASPGSGSAHALYVTLPAGDSYGVAEFQVGAFSHVIGSFDLLIDNQLLDGTAFESLYTSAAATTTAELAVLWTENKFKVTEFSAVNGQFSLDTVLELTVPAPTRGWVSLLVDVDLAKKAVRLSVRLDAETVLEASGAFDASGVGPTTEANIGGLHDSPPRTRVVIDNFVGNWQ